MAASNQANAVNVLTTSILTTKIKEISEKVLRDCVNMVRIDRLCPSQCLTLCMSSSPNLHRTRHLIRATAPPVRTQKGTKLPAEPRV